MTRPTPAGTPPARCVCPHPLPVEIRDEWYAGLWQDVPQQVLVSTLCDRCGRAVTRDAPA